MALGVLPYELLANRWRDVLLKLSSSCMIEVRVGKVVILIKNSCFGLYWTSDSCLWIISIE